MALCLVFFNLQRVLIPFGIAYVLALMFRPVQKAFYSVDIKRKGMSLIAVFGFIFIFSYPVVCQSGNFSIIQDIDLDNFSLNSIRHSEKELLEEREAIKHLL